VARQASLGLPVSIQTARMALFGSEFSSNVLSISTFLIPIKPRWFQLTGPVQPFGQVWVAEWSMNLTAPPES